MALVKISKIGKGADANKIAPAPAEAAPLTVAGISAVKRIADVNAVLDADNGDANGRSQWLAVRFSDGTLALATFPQGDAYHAFAAARGVTV